MGTQPGHILARQPPLLLLQTGQRTAGRDIEEEVYEEGRHEDDHDHLENATDQIVGHGDLISMVRTERTMKAITRASKDRFLRFVLESPQRNCVLRVSVRGVSWQTGGISDGDTPARFDVSSSDDPDPQKKSGSQNSLLGEQVHIDMFPGRAGAEFRLDLAGRGRFEHGLQFGAGAQGRLLQVVDVAAQELRDRLVGVRDDDDDDLLQRREPAGSAG